MVKFIIAHFGIQTGGNYSFEAFWMAMDTPNVVCESGWTFQARMVEFAKELPRHKIVFGTDSPPNEPGMWLRELEVLCGPPPQGISRPETPCATRPQATSRPGTAYGARPRPVSPRRTRTGS